MVLGSELVLVLVQVWVHVVEMAVMEADLVMVQEEALEFWALSSSFL